MIKSFTRYPLFLLLLLSTLLLSGCIKEDLSDCPTGLKVFFTYEPATYARTGVDPSEVDRIDLFVFDAQGIFRGVWIDEAPKLSPEYYMLLPKLPQGSYRFIAWGGLHECYSTTPSAFIVGKTTFDEVRLLLNHLTGEIPAGLHPLFHAEKTEPLPGIREQKVHLPLVQAYNTINLTTEGLPDNADVYRLTIRDNNGIYGFDHSFATDNNFNYTSACQKDALGQPKVSLNVLRLAADRHPQLELYNETQGKRLCSADLIALLNKIRDIDYNRIHTFDIHLKFSTDMVTLIMINGWLITETEIILY